MATVGDRIKLFGKAAFGSVSAMASALGKGSTFFVNYVNNRSLPGGELLRELSEAGCDIDWLLTGSGNMCNGTEAGRELQQKLQTGEEPGLLESGGQTINLQVIDSRDAQEMKSLMRTLISELKKNNSDNTIPGAAIAGV